MDFVEIFDLAPDRDVYFFLKETSANEREIICREPQYEKMCKLIDVDTRSKTSDTKFATQGRSTLKIMLESFGDFNTAMDFIKSVRPGFVYTLDFAQFVKESVKIVDIEGDTFYELGNMSYSEANNRKRTYLNNKLHSFGDKPAVEIRDNDNKVKTQEWFSNGVITRENDKPARIEYYDVFPLFYYWMKDGKVHRDGDQPAFVGFFNIDDNLYISEEKWYKNGKYFRENDLPNYIEYYKKDEFTEEIEKLKWTDTKNRLSRIGGPAYIEYYSLEGNKQQVRVEKWYFEGILHRHDGPALTEFYENGNKKEELWWFNGLQHKQDEPAVINYYKNGDVQEKTWYTDDKIYNPNGPSILKYYKTNDHSEILRFEIFTNKNGRTIRKETYTLDGTNVKDVAEMKKIK